MNCKKNLKTILKEKFAEQNITIDENLIPRAYELFGSVAIIDMSNFEHQNLLNQKKDSDNKKELVAIKKTIADALTKVNKNIKTILIKKDKLEGEFRTGEYEIIFGKNTDCVYKENNCAFEFDITKTYFSTKLGNERRILAESICDNEEIFCPFAGVCPFPIIIAKNKNVKITAVEKNPHCEKYAIRNILKNKTKDKIKFYCADILDFLKTSKKKYNRIAMLAPKINYKFVDLMFDFLDLEDGKTGIVDYYCFCKIDKNTDEVQLVKEEIKKKVKEKNLDCSFGNIRKCGNHAPYQFRIHIEINVWRK
ncbi:MAG: hypothetical protein KAQ92_07630 [Candidatus Aenigmarchaeota archaeon]|nr:hypothetical protein [Candidatus Aenigmarchaeota archaeon]